MPRKRSTRASTQLGTNAAITNGKENNKDATVNTTTASFNKSEYARACTALNQCTSSADAFLGLFGVTAALGNNSTFAPPAILLQEGAAHARRQRQLLKLCIREKQTRLFPFFTGLRALVADVTEKQQFIPEAAFEYDDDEHFADDVIGLDAASLCGLKTIDWAAICIKETYSVSPKNFTDNNDVWEIVEMLHDIMDQIDPVWGSEASSAQTTILSLCEVVWISKLPNRHQVIVKALPPLIESALQNKTDVKRLYRLREALHIIDFETEESQPFASLLLRVASSPACLKVPEGKKLLAYLFHVGLRNPTHQSIRAQIPENKRSVLANYGEIYFIAWKNSPDDESRNEFETEVLQDLMYSCIHAAKPGLSCALVTVLERFHGKKNQNDVEELLYRLYAPLIWRSLSAANATVRENTIRLLGEIFPLRSAEKSKNPLDKGVKALKKSLQDPNPKVRAAASSSVARILKVYWEVVPSPEIRSLLDLLVAHHASDATSALVRVGAVNAFAEILDCESSHRVLRELLPSIGNLIHDRTERVRLAVVKLLLRVKQVPDIKYYHVVPLEHLMARLAVEKNPCGTVSLKLAKLVVNSYAPTNADPVKLLERSLLILTKYPASATGFYSNLRQFRDPDFICQLIAYLFQYLSTTVEEIDERPATCTKRQRVKEELHQENRVAMEQVTFTTMAALLETVAILWESISLDLHGSVEWTSYLAGQIEEEMLGNLLQFLTKDHTSCLDDEDELVDAKRCLPFLMDCMQKLPTESVTSLVPNVKQLLFESAGSISPAQVSLLVSCDIDVASFLASSIRSSFEQGCFVVQVGNRAKRRATSTSHDDSQPVSPFASLQILDCILRGADATLRSMFLQSLPLERAMWEGIKRVEEFLANGLVSSNEPVWFPSNTHAQSNGDEQAGGLFIRLVNVYGRFLFHKSAHEINNQQLNVGKEVCALVAWTTEATTRCFQPQDGAVPFIDADVSAISLEPSFLASPASNRSDTLSRRSHGIENTSALSRTQQFGMSLIAEIGALCCEFLAVSRVVDCQEVSAHALRWCELAPSPTLLPLYGRLAVLIAKQGSSFALLRRIITSYHEDDDMEEECSVVRQAVGSLVSAKLAGLDALVDMVLEAADELLDEETETAFLIPESLEELWQSGRGSVAQAIEAIVSAPPKGSQILVQQASTKLKSTPSSNEKFQLFLVRCLCFLSQQKSKAVLEATIATKEIDRSALSAKVGDLLSGKTQQLDNQATATCT